MQEKINIDSLGIDKLAEVEAVDPVPGWFKRYWMSVVVVCVLVFFIVFTTITLVKVQKDVMFLKQTLPIVAKDEQGNQIVIPMSNAVQAILNAVQNK